jgi:cytochrome c553
MWCAIMEHADAASCSAQMRARVALILLALSTAGCGGPVAPPRQASGEGIAVGAGPGGAFDACFTCHGLNGEGRGDAPRLAGLDTGYLTKQLFDYASDRRADATMSPIARRLSDRDKFAVAQYYARMPAPEIALAATAPMLYLHGDVERELDACASCHGDDADGRGAGNPALAGQPANYTVEQLQRWKHGERRNDPNNVMAQIARQLTDEEIDALSRYLEGAH